jgi:hypothetical protein
MGLMVSGIGCFLFGARSFRPEAIVPRMLRSAQAVRC